MGRDTPIYYYFLEACHSDGKSEENIGIIKKCKTSQTPIIEYIVGQPEEA